MDSSSAPGGYSPTLLNADFFLKKQNLCCSKEWCAICRWFILRSGLTPFQQAARRLSAKQDLLQPLARLETRLCPRGAPWKESDEWDRSGCVQDRQPDCRLARSQRAARLHAESGPGQLQGESISWYRDLGTCWWSCSNRHDFCILNCVQNMWYMYNFLGSCCATACSWWSPSCSPETSPPRPTSPWINSCAPCPWLSLRNTVELPRSVARDHVTHGAKWNNKRHTAQTWMSPEVFSHGTV